MRSSSSTTGSMLVSNVLLLSPILCASAPHTPQHRYKNKLLARTALSATNTSPTAISSGPIDNYGAFLSGSASLCLGTSYTTAARPTSPNISPAENNTSYSTTPGTNTYTVFCDVDYVDQNISPFVLATSFEACLAQCQEFNLRNINGNTQRAGFVYAPDRVHDADDCYRKPSLNSAVPATITLIGATLATATSTATSMTSSTTTGKPHFLALQ